VGDLAWSVEMLTMLVGCGTLQKDAFVCMLRSFFEACFLYAAPPINAVRTYYHAWCFLNAL